MNSSVSIHAQMELFSLCWQYGRRLAAMKLWDPERATPEHMFCVAFLTTIIVAKVVLYRDTGSIDPGSGPIFGSVSGSEIHILGIAHAKDTFSLY